MATAAPAPNGLDENAPPWRWRGPVLGLAVVAALGGLVLRFYAPSPLWLDEALSVEIAQLSLSDMVEALRHDGHPRLYYLLLGGWMDVFGDSNAAARSLSAVASLATVPVLWAIGRRRSPDVAWVAAILGLTSPFLLRYGTEARMYALLTFFVALAWLAMERALERPDAARLALVAVSTALLINTHYWSFWLIGAAGLMLLATAWKHPTQRQTVKQVIYSIAIGGLSFAPWLGVFREQAGSTGTPWADRARPAEIAIETMQSLGGNNRFEGELLGVIFVVLAILGAVGFRRREAVELRFAPGPLTIALAATILTLGIGGAIALATDGAFEGRYSAVVVPFVLLLAARGIAILPGRALMGVLTVVSLFGLAVGVDEARRDRTQAGEVAAAIDAGHQPGDIVAFCPDQVGPATRRALQTEIAGLAYPSGDGHLVDWQDYAEEIEKTPPEVFLTRINQLAAGNDVWLVVGLGYKSLGNRCEAIIDQLNRTHRANHIISPNTAFEPMLLTRYEPLG